MGSELTESEDELFTLIEGLESQAADDESRVSRAEGNEKLLGSLALLFGGASYAADRMQGMMPYEKYVLAGASLAFVLGAIRENIHWQNHHLKAAHKRESLQRLYQDPDYDAIRDELTD